MTPFQRHVEQWKDCTDCDLCNTRRKIVLYRGSIPCDVLVVGEAPGPSEDMLGKSFIGPAGKLLDKLLSVAQSQTKPLAIGFTNLVACIPKDEQSGDKFLVPPKQSIQACASRLDELVRIAKPRLVITAGKLAEQWFPKICKDYVGARVSITHPAAILRADDYQKPLAIQSVLVTLVDVFSDL